jgi:hypothetical protein
MDIYSLYTIPTTGSIPKLIFTLSEIPIPILSALTPQSTNTAEEDHKAMLSAQATHYCHLPQLSQFCSLMLSHPTTKV